MLHSIPECLDRLGGNHRLPTTPDGRRDHHRQHLAVRIEHFADRHQRGLCVQRIENRLHQQEIGPARNQRPHLLAISRLHLIERDHSEPGIIGVWRIRQRHRQGSNRACHKPLPTRRVRHPVRPLPALPRGLLIDLPRQFPQELIFDDLLIERRILAPAMFARIVHKELALRNRRRTKRVGFDDVRPCFEEAPVDVTDHIGLGQREQIAVVEQVFRRILEALPADVRFRHAIGADGGAHRSVNDGDTVLKNLLKRMLVGDSH